MIGMDVADLAQVLAALAIAVGAGLFAGQIRAGIRQLQDITGDHEVRIRDVERRTNG